MKALTLILVFFISSFVLVPVEKETNLKKESLIDMIESAEFIPVYFVTKEAVYSHVVNKTRMEYNSSLERDVAVVTSYSSCKKITQGAPLPESYSNAYEKITSELNRVFKTDKFVVKPSSETPLTEKAAKSKSNGLSGWPSEKVQPNLKDYDFSTVTSPFFVFCSVGAIYESDHLVKSDRTTDKTIKEREEADVTVKDEIQVSLNGFANVRFLSYDAKKKKSSYADPIIFSIKATGDSFTQTECYSSITDFVKQLDPTTGAAPLVSESDGMFDEFAASKWKKQK